MNKPDEEVARLLFDGTFFNASVEDIEVVFVTRSDSERIDRTEGADRLTPHGMTVGTVRRMTLLEALRPEIAARFTNS
jgi:hypothetical protein